MVITAGILFACWILLGAGVLRALARLEMLRDVLDRDESRHGAGASTPLPSLSIVITALNEEADIERCVRRFAGQQYDGLQLIAVNDRSTDRTGEILDRVAREVDPTGRRIVPVHIRELPKGWLGKCHACHVGASRAESDWILFADGDVELRADDLLARVVRFAERNALDHVTVVFDSKPMTILKEAVLSAFAQIFLLVARLPEMMRDEPRGGVGVGAFNLIRRTHYERVQGHHRLKMDTADDLKLGILLRQNGARQRIYNADGLIYCAWQPSVVGVIRGLEKNYFGAFDYSLVKTIFATAFLAFLSWGPIVLPIVAWLRPAAERTPVFWAAVFAPLGLQTALHVFGQYRYGRRTGTRLIPTLLIPFGWLVMVIAAWNSAIRILARGGVQWRDTFYPISELKAGLLRPSDLARRVPPPG